MEITMQMILERLQEWKENIDCDVRNADGEPVGEKIRQSVGLSSAIGTLQGIGKNNNIHE